MGLGGEAFGGGTAFLVAFFAFWKMGASFFTSSSGADESPLLSESDIFAAGGWCCCGGLLVGRRKAACWWKVARSQGARATSERRPLGANGREWREKGKVNRKVRRWNRHSEERIVCYVETLHV